jgi:hypothetical protein
MQRNCILDGTWGMSPHSKIRLVYVWFDCLPLPQFADLGVVAWFLGKGWLAVDGEMNSVGIVSRGTEVQIWSFILHQFSWLNLRGPLSVVMIHESLSQLLAYTLVDKCWSLAGLSYKMVGVGSLWFLFAVAILSFWIDKIFGISIMTCMICPYPAPSF